ncbi:nickel pincer cofactor biosynthesis protein LarC [Butyrivibrio sp. XBB1001]|uniref:nickel pincer cofactor biosynthesis protein LarC n=1 Tax=Butyrivibrio sp. XBB1001 TaxID=1280682 RepID=UPI000422A0FF|nr:nickel pincer cofactor biosynthesis protein LarC [Butyrivibrio sp. XBB1001]
MKTLYIECKMGVAGDMLGAALLDLLDEQEEVLAELNEIGIKGVEFKLTDTEKCGIKSKHLRVLINGQEEIPEYIASDERLDDHEHHEHEHNHIHRTLYDIEDIIEAMTVSKDIKSDVREIYELLAEAESQAHGVPVDRIHFHEVGNLDAIADITASCYLIHKLEPEKIIVSPINVGGGMVKTAHGVLPVPAPATATLLKGIPSYESEYVRSELCTPTGAALIKYFADEFKPQPLMAVEKIGYGAGNKDFAQANVVRAVLGETTDEIENVIELACNIDDMTAEEIGFATEMLFEAGALEVYTIAADMKKNRPGTLLYCVCKLDKRDLIVQTIFKHTTTLGIRENICNRYVLSREIQKIDTPYGEVRKKVSSGYNVSRFKLEYDDIAGIAKRTGKSILDLKKELEEC